jgi:predicted DCC family thiol-disulfide oxidoreductase YuxK
MPAQKPALSIVFYDGQCPMCSGVVTWAARRDKLARLRFAPLGGETYQNLVPPKKYPDSVLLLTPEGRVLDRTRAVAALLRSLPQPWLFWGRVLNVIPLFLSDFGYRIVAALRPRRRPGAFCPIPPKEIRERLMP